MGYRPEGRTQGGAVMKAALATAYGGPEVMVVGEAPMPDPKAGEVRIRVVTAAVNTGDWRLRSLIVPFGFRLMVRLMFGWSKLRQPILGWECAGVVEALGEGVSGLNPGDEVVGWPAAPKGCHAEFACVRADHVLPRPKTLTWEEAGAMHFGAVTALTFLRWGGMSPGKSVLIIGASGTVGSAGVQIAKAHGMVVTAVSSGGNRDLVTALGADDVIDYGTTMLADLDRRWDMILDCTGTLDWPVAKRLLTPGGQLLAVVGGIGMMLRALLTRWSAKRVRFGDATGTRADLDELAKLVQAGKYRPLIDSTYDLADIRLAHERVDSGRKTGSVVLKISSSEVLTSP
jgi:NADPH:quinone reductase-like Zn-dependent oxidoreductase